jgi:hypothetical protein
MLKEGFAAAYGNVEAALKTLQLGGPPLTDRLSLTCSASPPGSMYRLQPFLSTL